jgi:hypothetical protein
LYVLGSLKSWFNSSKPTFKNPNGLDSSFASSFVLKNPLPFSLPESLLSDVYEFYFTGFINVSSYEWFLNIKAAPLSIEGFPVRTVFNS